MALAPGTRLGPYEIAALLGAGGIFYRAPDNRLVAVSVQANGNEFAVGESEILFEVPPKSSVVGGYTGWRYDVSADGRRFLVDTPVATNTSPSMTIVVNWAAVRTP